MFGDFMKDVVLITGMSSLGKELALYFKKLKYNVIITYNNNLDLEFINKYNIKYYHLDIKDDNSVKSLKEEIELNYKEIFLLINNASLSMDDYYMDLNKKDFMNVLETNIYGTYNMIRTFSNITKNIINISSTDSENTYSKYNLDYSISKSSINFINKYFTDFDKTTNYYLIIPNWINTESIRNMDQKYLKSELDRVKQSKLIECEIVCNSCLECLKHKSGYTIRIEG